jgi:ankyrin repeat protein
MESVYTTGLLSMNKYVKLLLNYPNIDVNIQNEHGVTALMMAVSNSYGFSTEETVKMLLKHPNIDVNIQDENGWTALMYAIKYSNINKRPDGMCVHYQNHHNQNVYDEEIQGTIKLLLAQGNTPKSFIRTSKY